MLPFTHQQFVFVFSVYNGSIWPLQPVVHAAGLLMIVLLLRPSRGRGAAALTLLAAMWIWTGVVYHIGFFSPINAAALAFGALFVLQGVLLLEVALHGTTAWGATSGPRRATGWGLLVYSLLVYPLIGNAMGIHYLDLPAFGLTPCPVTLTTIGMLLLMPGPAPRRLYVIPIAWALIGGSAAVLLRMPQDWILLLMPLMLATVVVHDHLAASRARPGLDRERIQCISLP